MEKATELRRRKYIVGIVVILIAVLLIGLLIFQDVKSFRKSPLHQVIDSMKMGADHWKTPENIPFEKNTAEAAFLEGLQCFGSQDYETAQELFQEALKKQGNDPALLGYTKFFLNETNYILTGVGNLQMVEETMEALTYYKPFREEMLWTSVLTLIQQEELRPKAVKMLEDYLKINQELDTEDWAGIKNSIAMIEYMDANYSKSVRDFYDVILRLERKTMTPRLKEELVYAREYIANIYYLFEDYEGAIVLYQELIEDRKNSGDVGIFSHYLNLSTAYLEIGKIDESKIVIKELEFLIPDMDPLFQSEIKANVLEVLACISMAENNYKKAGEYLQEAIALSEENGKEIIYGGWFFVELTYCRYLLHEGELKEAIQRLEKIHEEGNAKLYGIERDVYELLLEGYEKTGNIGKQIDIYRKQLKSEIEKESRIKKEYLDFSKYYRDANRLQSSNVNLSQTNSFAFLIICFSIIAYMVVFYLIRFFREREVTDQLTGVYNRKKLNSIYRKAQKKGIPENMGIMMADIDYFKKYNDTYGYMEGDQVLKTVAEILVGVIRDCDEVIRYGGEEFILILHDVKKESVVEICESIQKKLKQVEMEHRTSGIRPYITMSMGICIRKEKGEKSIQEMIEKAAELLYEAKKAGRDCFKIKEI